MTQHYDVVVVGAGFAGLTAARELSRAGKRVVVLEARDRIGGRTWVEQRLGTYLELGGTWVHWTQPHVWAELRRYGIGVVPSPTPVHAWWWDGTQRVSGSPEALLDELDGPNRALLEDARSVFDQPFSPLASSRSVELDTVSMATRIAQLDLSDRERVLLETFWTLNFNGKLDDAAFTQALRWAAVANGDWGLMFEACASFKVEGGTIALAEAMSSDSDAEWRFTTDVTSIAQTARGVEVSTSDGGVVTADDVVVTVPIHALHRIQFAPGLAAQTVAALESGQVGLGLKVWFAVEGEVPHFVAFGGADWPLNFLQSEYHVGGRTIVIGFGSDSTVLDPGSVEAVQDAVDRLVPDLRVVETAGHDWVADPLSGETWPMHRTGYLTTTLGRLQQPHGHVHFAGSDVADGWGGFIDGAIESGLTVSNRIIRSRLAQKRVA
jgi:monoamine oxidase